MKLIEGRASGVVMLVSWEKLAEFFESHHFFSPTEKIGGFSLSLKQRGLSVHLTQGGKAGEETR